MPFEQIVIAFTGAAAAWLSQDRRPQLARWACVFGLVGQPFWVYATWEAGQWGMIMLTLAYTGAWVRGAWVFWVKPLRAWRSNAVDALHLR
jgi:hypothetical protein